MIALAIALYAVPALITCRMVAGHVAWAGARSVPRGPDGIDWTLGCLAGAVAGIGWPFTLAWLATGIAVPAIGAEREALVARQRQRITELEREAGIR